MSNIPVTKCPKCGGTTIEAAAFLQAQLDDEIVCPGCGHRATKCEFLTDTVDKLTEIAKNAFRDIPGFKAK